MKETSPSVVDASVIVRFLVRDNESLYGRAARFLADVQQGRAKGYVPDAVIAESVFVLLRVYKVPRSEIVEALRTLVGYADILVDGKQRILATLDTFGRAAALSFVDAMCLEIAAERGWDIETYDLKLLRMAAARSDKAR